MRRIAKFHKVSLEQFKSGIQDNFTEYTEAEIRQMYEALKLPRRATTGSAGYDFFTPIYVKLAPGESIKIPTGIPGGNGRGLGIKALSQKRPWL